MKTVVLKLTGKALDNLFINDQWIKIINDLKNNFDALVIVHGAGTKISEWCWAFGYEPKFFNGQRVTDLETMEIVAAVQAGLLNVKFVSRLQTSKVPAIGLTGIDNGLFNAEYFNENLGYVGYPVLTGETDWLCSIMKKGIIPVFSSVCRDKEGNLMNVNADVFTRELALVLKADTVLFLSDINGVKLNGSLQPVINEKDINEGIQRGEITDGMIPKLQSSLELIKNGIQKVWIGNDLSNQDFKEFLFFLENKETHSENNLKGTLIVESKAIAV